MCLERHIVPRALQPELGFVPQVRDGDTTAENPAVWALNLEAINKSTPHFGGASKAECLPALLWSPRFPAALPSLEHVPSKLHLQHPGWH